MAFNNIPLAEPIRNKRFVNIYFIMVSRDAKEFEDEVFRYLRERKPEPDFSVSREQPIGITGVRIDIAVWDMRNGTLKEIYEIKANDDPYTIKVAQMQLGAIVATLGEKVDAYVVVPSNKPRQKLSLIKQDTVYVNSLYARKTVDRFNVVCWGLAALTFVLMLLSVGGYFTLTAIDFSLYLVFVALVVAPFVSEMRVGALGWKRTNQED